MFPVIIAIKIPISHRLYFALQAVRIEEKARQEVANMADTNMQETKELQNEHTENTDENIIEMPTEKPETDKAVDEKENTVVEDATASDEKPKAEETDEKAEEKVEETSGSFFHHVPDSQAEAFYVKSTSLGEAAAARIK